MVGGSTVSADFSADFAPTASLCVWAIYTHLGRLEVVVAAIAKVARALRHYPRAKSKSLISIVHVLYLVSVESKP